MELAINIKLTEHQYYLLKEMARQEYRTLGNTFAMLAAEGLNYFFVDNSVYIKKRPEHCETDHPNHEHYGEGEIIEEFAKIPLQQ